MKKIFLGLLVGALVVIGATFANKFTDDNSWLPMDAMNQAVQVPAGFQTMDATGTPQTSPLTVSNIKITIVVPDGAAELVIVYTDISIRVSEDTTMAQYFVLPAGFSAVIPVANLDNVFLIRDGANDATVQFFFNLLEN